MVIPDWSAPKPPKIEFVKSEPGPEQLARPLDRLAAVIVDVFVLLVPLYILLSAPFKRSMTASFILGAEPDFIALVACMVALGVFLVVVYQAVLHYFWSATFGKMLFDLRVQPVFGEPRLTFSVCVGRAFLWILECLCLGLPFLSVFSNARRRTVHDRVFDTVVVTRSTSGVLAPAGWERGLVRGFFAACMLFICLVASVEARRLFEKMKTEKGLSAIIEKDIGACDIVSKNMDHEDAVEGEEGEHARLQLAMSLYAAGLVDRSCLGSELEREMAMQTAVGPITYLAQAFVNSDDAEVSNSYLDQVCEDAPGAIECTMSQVVSKWSEEDWEGVEQLLGSAPKGSGYLEVWAVRHFMKQARYGRAIAFLDSLTDHHELSEFSQVQRVKALYNGYQSAEARVALAQALPSLSREEGEDVSAWMCAQELQNGCDALEKISCRDIPAGKGLAEIDFEHTGAALARVMALECRDEKSVDYLTFSEAVKDEDWQVFFRANLKRQKDDPAAAYELFAELIRSPSAPELLRVEALRRVAQFAQTPQLASLVEMWRGFESKEAWVKGGNILLSRFTEHKNQDWAVRVARHLMKEESLSPQGLARLTEMAEAPTGERRPASVMPTTVNPSKSLKTLLDSDEEEE